MRIAVGDDAHYLGVAGRFISQIFDALAGAYGLGDAGGSRVDAVRRRFFLNTVVGLIEKIGIDLFFDRAVDGKIVQFMFRAASGVSAAKAAVENRPKRVSKARKNDKILCFISCVCLLLQ